MASRSARSVVLSAVTMLRHLPERFRPWFPWLCHAASCCLVVSACGAPSPQPPDAPGFSRTEPGHDVNSSSQETAHETKADDLASLDEEGNAAEPAESVAEPAPVEPPPLPEGTVVLHVGSSSAGALGIELDKELEARGV